MCHRSAKYLRANKQQLPKQEKCLPLLGDRRREQVTNEAQANNTESGERTSDVLSLRRKRERTRKTVAGRPAVATVGWPRKVIFEDAMRCDARAERYFAKWRFNEGGRCTIRHDVHEKLNRCVDIGTKVDREHLMMMQRVADVQRRFFGNFLMRRS